jgi:hypothetical protein
MRLLLAAAFPLRRIMVTWLAVSFTRIERDAGFHACAQNIWLH